MADMIAETAKPKDPIDAWLAAMLAGTAGANASNVPRPPRLWAIRANKLHAKKMAEKKLKENSGEK